MKRVFISQPMRNRTDEEIKAEREMLTAYAAAKYGCDVYIIDSFFECAPHAKAPLWFLGKSFELMSKAEVAIFAPSWESARGCRMEHMACELYNIPIDEYNTDEDDKNGTDA